MIVLFMLILFSLFTQVALADEPNAEWMETIIKRERAINRAQLEGEYYRGIYDICVWTLAETYGANTVQACNQMVQEFKRANWFNLPSEGWHWPLVPAFRGTSA